MVTVVSLEHRWERLTFHCLPFYIYLLSFYHYLKFLLFHISEEDMKQDRKISQLH